MSTKFPKARLKEELDKRKKFGATWEWKSTNLGNGRYSAICEFYLEAGSPPVTGTGEGQGLKAAEHAAALEILNKLEIDFKFQNTSQSQNESPKTKETAHVKSPAAMQYSDSLEQPVNEEVFQVSNKVWLYPNQKIGGGGFSEVFKGFKETRESEVAVKRVNQSEAEDPKSRELQILRTTKHPNLVLYYFLERNAEYFYFVLELANCDLEEWIFFKDHDTETLVKVCKDVGLGLKELHKNKIVHRDIKPKNVLIFNSEVTGKIVYTAKLADFGISRILNENEAASAETTQGHLGTQTYLPPEVKPQMTLDLSFDIFSLGILFAFVMTTGKHIFAWPGQTEFYQIRSKISKNKPNWNILSEKQFTSLRNLLQVMLSNDPTKRGNISQILEHPFFWDEEESYNFVVNVCKEITNGEACTTAIVQGRNAS